MIRRILVAIALAAGAGAYGLAIERATFILIDGERKSGTVVFHTPARENLVNNYLNLGTDDGKEMTFPVDQVAVIDFAGGRPGTPELAALPAGGTHLLVLRDGNSQQGHLLNLVDGETVIWRTMAGQDQRYAIRDVTRIYLNPDRARTAFNYDPNRAGGSGRFGRRNQNGVATSGTIASGAIPVSARQMWTDTGIDVRQGDRVAFRVTGQIQWGSGPDSSSGADGNTVMMKPDFPVPSVPVGAFIGRVGNGPGFGIGNQTQPLSMPASGRLYVGVNDTYFDDNSGSYTVYITR